MTARARKRKYRPQRFSPLPVYHIPWSYHLPPLFKVGLQERESRSTIRRGERVYDRSVPFFRPPRGREGTAVLLPASDVMSEKVATNADRLRAQGWRLLTCPLTTLKALNDKLKLQETAEKLHLSQHMPRQYLSPDTATYPCIFKQANGEYGETVKIVQRREDAVGDESTDKGWLFQELVPGQLEISTTLVVDRGVIKFALRTAYTYSKSAYVWGQTPGLRETNRSWSVLRPTSAEFKVLAKFCRGNRTTVRPYSGVCNFNYKLRPGTREMAIFEVNTRIGGDFADAANYTYNSRKYKVQKAVLARKYARRGLEVAVKAAT